MRVKESVSAENVVLNKLVEKQTRAYEMAQELEHSLSTQLVRILSVFLYLIC